jgi:hypothetical protein
MKRNLLAAAVLIVLFLPQSAPLAAAPAATPLKPAPPPVIAAAPTAPDPAANPVLAMLQKSGAKLFYLGNRYEMDGWFILKDGQVQIIYAPPGNKAALVGALFSEDGQNLTSLQLAELIKDNPEAAALLGGAQKEQAAIAQAGSPSAAPVSPSTNGLPAATLSPGERLVQDLSGASTVVIGNVSSPELLMVMDPHCLHCQATWKVLRDPVFKGTMHIRMIPIGPPDSDNERAAAVLLSSGDPLNMWDKYVGGDHSVLAGTPSATALTAVRANHQVIDSWSIQDTPYLVYRAKDGKVKVVVGEPDKVSAVLSDMGLQ